MRLVQQKTRAWRIWNSSAQFSGCLRWCMEPRHDVRRLDLVLDEAGGALPASVPLQASSMPFQSLSPLATKVEKSRTNIVTQGWDLDKHCECSSTIIPCLESKKKKKKTSPQKNESGSGSSNQRCCTEPAEDAYDNQSLTLWIIPAICGDFLGSVHKNTVYG